MALDPVVIQIPIVPVPTPPPESRWAKIATKLHLPHFGLRTSKLITAIAAVIIAITMTLFAVLTVLSSNASFRAKHGLDINQQAQPAQTSGSIKSAAALPGGGTATGVGGTTGTNAPVVTLTASKATVSLGDSVKLDWSVTNNPQSCTASDDWSGSKAVTGSEQTGTLSKVQTYLYTLTCKTKTGTGFSTVSVQAIAQGGTGSVATRPTVTLSVAPSAIYTSQAASITWSATNAPSSCTASGDWSGLKSASGSESTGAKTTAKTYTFTLTCKSGSESGYATATLLVMDPPQELPLVSLTSNPAGPINPGASATLTWSVMNDPTSCTASGDWAGTWTGASAKSGSVSTGSLNTIKTYNFTLTCKNSSGDSFNTANITVVPTPPTVNLTVSPSSITTGSSATLTWSSTGSPTSCTASGAWSGAKAASGTASTGTLTTAKTYLYNLSCTNAGGTGYNNNVALIVNVPTPPTVTISANPISITSGSSSTLTWSATGSPSSCTASGDWSGSKAASGTVTTGTLTTVKTYTYTLACTNAGGTGNATTTVAVSSGAGGAVKPVTTISVSPTTIGTGSSSTITWNATNTPTSCTASGSWSGSKSASGSASTGTIATAGSYTYTLTCSNAAGSSAASATLTVVAVPAVTISVSPSTITAGGSATITWSATNTPTSCTAGGSWSGTKAASGSQTTGAIATAGSYTYSLSCTNSGGTGSNSAGLTVNAAAAVYCSGSTPCYGPTDLNSHVSTTDCWAYNLNRTFNITTLNSWHKGSGPSANLLPNATTAAALCGNKNLLPFLSGTNLTGVGSHNHTGGAKTNNARMLQYVTGYYDATKP